ncbi:MAG: 2-oxoacid:acceptor oxidoreductase subunit alpha [Pseudomonadota bacterium]
MSRLINDFSITVATVNGSGSQSANNILMRSIFRMGVPVSGKNLFPSNIAGLPTWFSIRVSEKGYVGRRPQSEIVVAMNKETLIEDLKYLQEGGLFVYNSDLRFDTEALPATVKSLGIPFGDLAKKVSPSIQLKKLLVNMVYVGVLTELMDIPQDVVDGTIEHQFKGKESVFQINKDAVMVGRDYVKDNDLKSTCQLGVEKRDLTQDKILIDGNTSGALGLVYGGCSFASWYPITPSSSLAENFESFCHQFRKDSQGKNNFSMVQAEDELSAISMVAGAGWAGSRAMTATSGPGVSLMAETIGLMYFAEIPGLIWDVQRMGPSTGLPTRTSQGDLLSAAYCSHGDTRHPVFLPATPKECFEFAGEALELSEKAQTPVFVLSDLDLGMNFWMSDRFESPQRPLDRGKVLKKNDLEERGEFARYKDVDGDGIPYRTLPGTEHELAAYFTRGTSHTPEAKYSEDAVNHQELLNRLDRKWETIKTMVPKPEIHRGDKDLGIVFYGSTDLVMPEFLELLDDKVSPSWMRVRSFPFHKEVDQFILDHDNILVIEQNQQGQMTQILRTEFPQWAHKISSQTNCDGLPLSPTQMVESFKGGVQNGHE